MISVRVAVLAVHIVAGSLGLVFGFAALYAAKGARVHRKSGMLFVYAMLTMSIIGATIAVVWNVAPGANAPIAVLTAYLVLTGLTTVRPPATESQRLEVGLMMLALTVCLVLVGFGGVAITNANGKLYGMPSFPFFVFAAIALVGAVGDYRVIRARGVRAVHGTPRLARHLWRMCTALLIAAFSFFLGQAKVFPKPIRIFPLLVIPPLVVLVTMFYWMWRVRARRGLRGAVIVRAPEPVRP